MTSSASCNQITLREEVPADAEAIFTLTADAFRGKRFSDGTEPHIINRLRRDGDLSLSLVAVKAQAIVGHVAFSKVTINSVHDHWYGLGPVSVTPDLQKQGIGTTLINAGLKLMQEQNACGIALIGDPGYYCRFGFSYNGKLKYRDIPDKNVQYLAWKCEAPVGELAFCPAFEDTSQ